MEKIYLSRRNLLVLLSKLDRFESGESTFCTIIKYKQPNAVNFDQTMDSVMIQAVPDKEYYEAHDRPAGKVIPEDEPIMKRWGY